MRSIMTRGSDSHFVRCDGGLPIATVPGVHRFIPTDRAAERIARCMAGLALFGLGIALLIDANLGAAPWDVFHTGVSELTGCARRHGDHRHRRAPAAPVDPARRVAGPRHVLNAFEIGLVVDVVLPILPEPEALVPRVAMMLGGVVVIAVGSGLYIGAGLGPGPRDGLMTGLGRHGLSIRLAPAPASRCSCCSPASPSAARSASAPPCSRSASARWCRSSCRPPRRMHDRSRIATAVERPTRSGPDPSCARRSRETREPPIRSGQSDAEAVRSISSGSARA